MLPGAPSPQASRPPAPGLDEDTQFPGRAHAGLGWGPGPPGAGDARRGLASASLGSQEGTPRAGLEVRQGEALSVPWASGCSPGRRERASLKGHRGQERAPQGGTPRVPFRPSALLRVRKPGQLLARPHLASRHFWGQRPRPGPDPDGRGATRWAPQPPPMGPANSSPVLPPPQGSSAHPAAPTGLACLPSALPDASGAICTLALCPLVDAHRARGTRRLASAHWGPSACRALSLTELTPAGTGCCPSMLPRPRAPSPAAPAHTGAAWDELESPRGPAWHAGLHVLEAAVPMGPQPGLQGQAPSSVHPRPLRSRRERCRCLPGPDNSSRAGYPACPRGEVAGEAVRLPGWKERESD